MYELVNTARCDYLNASIAPMNIICIRCAGWWLLNNRFHQNQSHIEHQALLLMCIQSLDLWEQPTFNMLIQPSNGDGFGERDAHTPIDRLFYFTHWKRYVCCIYRNWGILGIGGELKLLYAYIHIYRRYEHGKRINLNRALPINIRHTFSVGFHPANSKYRFCYIVCNGIIRGNYE